MPCLTSATTAVRLRIALLLWSASRTTRLWKSHSASGKIKESEPDSMYFPVVKMSGMH